MFSKPPRDPHKKAAYWDGWKAAGLGAKEYDRPSYLTHGEREAFSRGWYDRADRIALGYCDRADAEPRAPHA